MADLEITLSRVPWSDKVRDHLARVEHFAPHTSPDWYRQAIEDDQLLALGVFYDGDLVGLAVYGFEYGDQGREMVIFAASGELTCEGEKVDLTATVYPYLEGIAVGVGCESIRFHTRRRGLVKRMAHLGYEFAEIILRKDLTHGR